MIDSDGKKMTEQQICEALRREPAKKIVEFAHGSLYRGFYKGENHRLGEYEMDVVLCLKELARRSGRTTENGKEIA